jgi:hypothetical protein
VTETESPRPKKPAGWYSKAAKAERAGARSEERRRRKQAAAARARRKAAKLAKIAQMVKVAARRLAPIVLARSIERAREADPQNAKTKKKKAKKKAAKAVLPTSAPVSSAGYVDVIATMFRRGHIDKRAQRAAEVYRDAYDTVRSHGMSGTLNPDKTGGGGSHGRPPPEEVLVAAETLNLAASALGKLDSFIVEEMVGKGASAEDIAVKRYGAKGLSKDGIAKVRARLKDALTVLAEEWFPAARDRNSIVGEMADGAKPTDMGDDFRRTVEPANVAHAGAAGVAYGDKTSGRSGRR